MIRLAQGKVLAQDMNCIETLARVDVLCVDKTGTITEPHMEVGEVVYLDEEKYAETVVTETLNAFYPVSYTHLDVYKRQILHQIESGGPLDVVDDPPSLGHHLGHGGEVGVEEHELGGVAGGVGAGGHGDAAVGVLEGQHVVDTVAGHGHGVALPLEGADQLALLVGGDPAEDGVLPHRAGDVLIGAEGGCLLYTSRCV